MLTHPNKLSEAIDWLIIFVLIMYVFKRTNVKDWMEANEINYIEVIDVKCCCQIWFKESLFC